MTKAMGSRGVTLMAAAVAAACGAGGCAGDDDDGAVADRDAHVGAAADGDQEVAAALSERGTARHRLVAPLSGSVVGSRRPRVTWSGAGSARVDFCRDSACGRVIASVTTSESTARPPRPLPPGPVFWRVRADGRGFHGRRLQPHASATWVMFVPHGEPDVPSSVVGVRLDVDRDGFADGALREESSSLPVDRLHIHLGGHDGLAAAPAQLLPLGEAHGFGRVSAVGDVNGDGHGDVAVGNENGEIWIFFGARGGVRPTPAIVVDPLLDPAAPHLSFWFELHAAGDVNGDGYGDFTAKGRSSYLFLGGAGGPNPVPAWQAGPGQEIIGTGDVNGDGFGDILVAEPNGDAGRRILVLAGSDAGVSTTPLVVMPKVDASLVADVGDVNGDGYADVFVELFIPSVAANVTHMHLGGAAGPGALPDNVFPFRGLPRGDFNGDGFADVVATIAVAQDSLFYTDDAIEIYPGNAGGITATATLRLEEESPAFMGDILNFFDPTQAADFDNDGYDDLPITAAPSYPTPFYDERPSKVFIVRGGADGLATEPALTLSGAPGYGVAFTAGD